MANNNNYNFTSVRSLTIAEIGFTDNNTVAIKSTDGKQYCIKNSTDQNGNITKDRITAAQNAKLDIGSTIMALCSKNKNGGFNILNFLYRGMMGYSENPDYSRTDINGKSYLLLPKVWKIRYGERKDGTPYCIVSANANPRGGDATPMWVSLSINGDNANEFMGMLSSRGVLTTDENGNPAINPDAEAVGVMFTLNANPNTRERRDGQGQFVTFQVESWEVVK